MMHMNGASLFSVHRGARLAMLCRADGSAERRYTAPIALLFATACVPQIRLRVGAANQCVLATPGANRHGPGPGHGLGLGFCLFNVPHTLCQRPGCMAAASLICGKPLAATRTAIGAV